MRIKSDGCVRIKIFFIVTLVSATTYPVTLVYNLRVRRIFNIAPVLARLNSRVVISTVPIYFARSRAIVGVLTGLQTNERRRAGGSLFNMRYIYSKHWWAEVTTGLETDHGTFEGSDPYKASRTGFDDVVFSSGYHHFLGNNGQVIGYWLVGVPTRRKVTLVDRNSPLVGTRFYNVGVGLEGSYSIISELQRSCALIAQGRLIHGFNRSWFPILPRNAEIQPGNGTDLLFTIQYRKRRTIFEGGYDVTFFTNQALIFPTQTISTDTFVRHSGYGRLTYIIPTGALGKPIILGAGTNVSYTKQFDSKAFTAWIYCSLVF
jgi:hypothetical protein